MKNVSVFESGVVDMMRDEMEALHYDTSKITDDLQLIQAYFTLGRRLVPVRTYRVLEAQGFTVPEDVKDGYELLKKKLTEGQDVTPHLHKQIASADAKDLMMFDWGIHHFHLGTVMEGSFIKRTGNVLYAIVKEDTVYCIVINPHQHWSDQEMLDVVNANWPHLLDECRTQMEFAEPEFHPTNQEINELRKMSVNSILELSDGTKVMGRGGGIAGDNSSAACMMYAINIRHYLMHVEKKISAQFEELNGMPDAVRQYNLSDLTQYYREGTDICVKSSDGALKCALVGIPSLKERVGK